MCPYRPINRRLPTIRKIPDDLWDEIKLLFPPEKSEKTIGRPVIPFRKVLDGIVYILRTGCQWKMLPKEYGSGSYRHALTRLDNVLRSLCLFVADKQSFFLFSDMLQWQKQDCDLLYRLAKHTREDKDVKRY